MCEKIGDCLLCPKAGARHRDHVSLRRRVDRAGFPDFLSSRLPLLAESPWKRQSCYVQHHRPMHPVEKYLQEIQQIHPTGAAVPETSYYSALSELLNAVGARLKPKVRCIAQLKNKGAGSPDFGLYTSPQFQTSKDREPLPGQKPERGVVEVKPVKAIPG